jgi:hypothetical protein
MWGSVSVNETDYQEDYLRDRINNPKNAINGLLSEEQLEELGFEKLQRKL